MHISELFHPWDKAAGMLYNDIPGHWWRMLPNCCVKLHQSLEKHLRGGGNPANSGSWNRLRAMPGKGQGGGVVTDSVCYNLKVLFQS